MAALYVASCTAATFANHVACVERLNLQAVLDFKGGEDVALKRLKYYLWDSDLLATYFDTRNGMLGGDYSTKFEPWMAAGCLSPRLIYHEIRKYERERVENKSTYWVIFECIWRDFFRSVEFLRVGGGSSVQLGCCTSTALSATL